MIRYSTDGRRMLSFVHNTTTYSIVLCIVHVWTPRWLSRRGGCKGHVYHMSFTHILYPCRGYYILCTITLPCGHIPIPIVYIYLYPYGYKPGWMWLKDKPYIHLTLIPSIPISVVLDRESLGVSKG